MKTLFQINVVANSGSTGHIAEELGRLVIASGWKSYIAYGRWACPSQSMLIRVGTRFDLFVHGLKSMFFDRHGFGSRRATLHLISKIEKIKPDIIHLHNLHGYYLNCEVLFDYLSTAKIPVVWTLHDCWSFTGHCVHFQNIGCEKWQTGCFACPNIRDYPKALGCDNSRMNFIEKKRLFTSVERMMIVPVCNWLSDMLSKSYLSQIKRQTIVNGIDLEMFTPKGNRDVIKSNLGVGTQYMILAVATVWGITKGFDDLIYLNSLLPDKEDYWGIAYDDTDITSLEKCRFYACIAIQKRVGSNPPLTNPIKHMDLPQGTYAVYIHQGDYALLDAFYEIILKQLPQSYCLGETPILEHYLNSPADTDVKELLTEVWIPIIK